MRDLNVHCKSKVLTDATTGKAIASRRGLGRVRHIDVSNLWIQEKVADESIELQKIKHVYNPADLMTKHLAETGMQHCVELIDTEFLDGRSPIAPDLNMLDVVTCKHNSLHLLQTPITTAPLFSKL